LEKETQFLATIKITLKKVFEKNYFYLPNEQILHDKFLFQKSRFSSNP
jgi:hypothetical protein